ncbi:YtxH domain-containing protein [Staphylococcus hominis]|uniref:EscU/YscU/HrcU family type III secretion system export apparatus switch protein n=1 Tax=Staphylococcus TaxID=1279 RepID=UPI00066CFFC6|nr:MULTISPECIES: EscU/YscU/HrcU family type III secretion system export apparatus switch protein [Staphylococcus]OFN39350.1 lytic transglycosylase [Staphylococcus sp. HMSC069E10]OFV22139.1 lytic transglycosylase [Staphylococcus sp. HMSC14C01]MBC2956102.1 YtxH domain-containing protein [Staphylococcus hominis]MBS6061957.1 YtxH domain-containing protein [Staphylococcus sp.]MBU5607111.1 YtxH domain-containing protein [Staphylococcus hominis]
MFKFHSLAFKNAKSQLIKTILFSLVSFIIVFVAFVIARTFFVQNFMQMQLAAQFQQSSGASLVMIILVLVLGLLFFILAGYQLLAGAFNIMAKAIEKEAVQFFDLFFAFKKGKYVKSLLLALITIILYAVLYLITLGLNFLFNKALTPLFTSIQQSVSTSDHAIGILLTVQIILIIIMGFILSIVYWFFFILMINYTVSFARKNDLSAIGHFKDGFKGIKNGRKTWFKFFLAILLINLLIIIITQPLGTVLTVLTGNMSQNVAQVILIIAQTLIIIVRLILYFVIIMGIVQYFLRRGENVKRPVKEKKKSKRKEKKEINHEKEALKNDPSSFNDTKNHVKEDLNHQKNLNNDK